MGPVSVTRSIDAPRDHVFGLIADLANRSAFTDHFTSKFRLERLDSSGVGAAARFRVTELGMWAETVIEEVSPPHRMLERGRGGRLDRIPMSTGWELVEGIGSEATELTITFWTDPSHPLDRLREKLGAERWWRRNWTIALRRLAALAEGDRTVSRVQVAGADRIPS